MHHSRNSNTDSGYGGAGLCGWGGTIINCTFANSSTAGAGGGIKIEDDGSGATIYLKNTILANNSSGTGGKDFHLSNGTVNDNGYNIVENSSGYTFSATGDITGEQSNLNLSTILEDNNTFLTLAIYDVNGKLVRTFTDGKMWTAGSYSIIWDGKDNNGNIVNSGTYFCKMFTEQYSEVKSMVSLK